MESFTDLIDLAAERLGGSVIAANDDFFAPKENLVKASAPEWREGVYTDRGKWMDGWETRRRRTPGHDWAIVKLGAPGIVRGIVIDTSFFTGNYPERASIDFSWLDDERSLDEITGDSIVWAPLLPEAQLNGNALNLFPISSSGRVTHLRLNIFPDGGVARLRVHGKVVPDEAIFTTVREVDLAAALNGGFVVSCSDMHYGNRQNLVLPGRSTHMGDGWETKRRRGPGHDWAIVHLARRGIVERVELDTDHFKGNAPGSCMLEYTDVTGSFDADEAEWKTLLPDTPLEADAQHHWGDLSPSPATHVRLNIYPDGGVARLRLFGRAVRVKQNATSVHEVNSISADRAAALLVDCCGSSRWATRMVERRPFDSRDAVLDAADEIWRSLTPADFLEAFAHHPRIGEQSGAIPQGKQGREWSSNEQSALDAEDLELREEVRDINSEYERRFGYIYIVCATGKTGIELLEIARDRLKNDAETELAIAAEEQRKITRLRLEKLLAR
jgi:allantoicase